MKKEDGIDKVLETTEKILRLLFKDKMETLIFEDEHATNLKHYFKKDKKKFLEEVVDLFLDKASLSILINGVIKEPLISSRKQYCFNCGKYLSYKLEGNSLKVVEDCDYNTKEYSVVINVPSGKLVFCDWPIEGSKILGHLDSPGVSINCKKGCFERSKIYSKEDIMHFFVGNTCPTVSQKGNTIHIESVDLDEDDNEIYTDSSFQPKGSICTDLWWATAFDLEIYKNLLKDKFGEDFLSSHGFVDFLEEVIIIDVKPGFYECTNYYDIVSNGESTRLFSKIDRIKSRQTRKI